MKKQIVFLLTGMCALALLAGCGENKTNNTGEQNNKVEGAKEAGKDEESQNAAEAGKYVTLGEYKGMEISVEKAKVTEETVKSSMESLMNMYPAYEPSDKTVVEDGDSVNIDYEGLLDGVAFDGGTASDQVLKIGSGSFIDGFEEGLIGAKVGDKVALDLTFPDPYQSAELAGKAVVFNVTVNSIVEPKEMTVDTITDEYVASNFAMYGFQTVEDFKNGIKETLTSQNETTADTAKRNAVIEKLKEVCTVNQLPDGELEKRIKDYTEEFKAMCKEKYDMELEDYLKENYQSTIEDFNTQTEEYMKDNLEVELMLLAIAEKEKLKVDEEGYQNLVSQMMQEYSIESEEALNEKYGKEFIQDSYLCNKAVDLLIENAKVTYTEPKDDAGAENAADNTEDGKN